MGKTGPNDASGVVWALVGNFFAMSTSTTRVWRGNETGPNDASGIVWARGMSFFSYLCITLTTRVCRGNEEEKTGPNDASGIVWALGKFFIFIFRVFSNLTNIFILSSFYLCIKSSKRVWMGGEGKKGPK